MGDRCRDKQTSSDAKERYAFEAMTKGRKMTRIAVKYDITDNEAVNLFHGHDNSYFV